ncbi:hypothetical protein BLNAU_2732 [Blattamonas nauphoetae]|uniref:Uncharacterized protein n=1 Tax=Blattamonas nauphoetae TaxID=2049346 RepID=A0ABQ9YFE2_9EUKA|nr:hypothetical protein BLNAU_2732 [Blattamonas nauphoetae]
MESPWHKYIYHELIVELEKVLKKQYGIVQPETTPAEPDKSPNLKMEVHFNWIVSPEAVGRYTRRQKVFRDPFDVHKALYEHIKIGIVLYN